MENLWYLLCGAFGAVVYAVVDWVFDKWEFQFRLSRKSKSYLPSNVMDSEKRDK